MCIVKIGASLQLLASNNDVPNKKYVTTFIIETYL